MGSVYRIFTCTIENCILTVFVTQGFALLAISVPGVLTYTCIEEECQRLKGRNYLLLFVAVVHIISSSALCRCCNFDNKIYKTFFVYTFTLEVLYTISMTALVNMLVVPILCLFWKQYKTERLTEKLTQP